MHKLVIHLLSYMKLYMHLAGIATYIIVIHIMKTYNDIPFNTLDIIIGLLSVFFIIELEYRVLFKKIVETLKDQLGIGDK